MFKLIDIAAITYLIDNTALINKLYQLTAINFLSINFYKPIFQSIPTTSIFRGV